MKEASLSSTEVDFTESGPTGLGMIPPFISADSYSQWLTQSHDSVMTLFKLIQFEEQHGQK